MLDIVEVEREMMENANLLEELATTISDLGKAAAVADAANKTAYAKAILRARARTDVKMTEEWAKAIAQAETEDEYLAHQIAANAFTAARESSKAAMSRMDGLRTLSANLRAVTTGV